MLLRKILIVIVLFCTFQNTVCGNTIDKPSNIKMIASNGVCLIDDHKYYHIRKLNDNTYAIIESLHYGSQEPIAYLFMGRNKDLLMDTGQKIKNKNDSEISSLVLSMNHNT